MNRGKRRLAPLLISSALLAGPAFGCKPPSVSPMIDAAGPAMDAMPPLTLNIAVTGCGAYDPGAARCSGAAPLALYFAPVGSQQFSRFTWTFGDGSPLSTERAPMHEFLLPGRYEVDLVGAFGNANTVKSTTVVSVEPREAGQPCDLDPQCATGLRCTCAAGAGCSPAFLRGLCSIPCDGVACAPPSVCASLALAPPPDGGAPALLPWCVAPCQTSADCAPGFACETLAGVAGGNLGPWTKGCLPIGALGDVGAPCRNANGQLSDAACATGSCLDLGALGSCSAPCGGDRACPPGTACAVMADGRQLCLVDCATAACSSDPLLRCSAPAAGGNGDTGFHADAGAGALYCAPTPCTGDADCAPAGLCGPGAQCVRSSS